MNICYFRGLPVSVWRAALQRRPTTAAAVDPTPDPAPAGSAPTCAAPTNAAIVFEGLARAA